MTNCTFRGRQTVSTGYRWPSGVRAGAVLLAGLLLSGWLGCSSDEVTSPTRAVVVMAAASLTDVVTELTDRYEARHPDVDVVTVFAASSTLARQLEQGARADLFLSANTAWMDRLMAASLVAPEDRRDPLGNRLVVIVPAGSTGGPTTPADLGDPDTGRIALADTSGVPAGIYARQALEALGVWSRVEPRAIFAPDVRVAVAYVERAEVDAAIVYRTDARISPRVVERFALPADVQPDIRYSFARLRDAPSPALADAVLADLMGAEARAVYERYGFTWIGGDAAAVAVPTTARPGGGGSWGADWQVIRLSLLVAAIAVLICLPFGVATGWLLARKQFRGKSVVENLAHLPLVLPPAVTGVLLLVVLGRHGPIGGVLDDLFGIQIAFTWLAAALAAAAVSFPLLVQSVRVATEAVDPGLEAAARTLGAGPWRVVRTVTLPLAAPGIIGGLIVTFARALGELGATLVFAGNTPGRTQTIPLAVWSRVSQVGGEASALRLVVLSVILSYLSLFVASRLQRRTLARSRGQR